MVLQLNGYPQKYLINEDVNNDTIIPTHGYARKYDISNYAGYGFVTGSSSNDPPYVISYGKSWQFREGFWGRVKLNNWYAIGSYLEYSRDAYRLRKPVFNDSSSGSEFIWTKQVNNNITLGIFNRFMLNGNNILLDLGANGSFDIMPRIIEKIRPADPDYSSRRTIYNNPKIMNRFNYGLDIRLTYGSVALYAKYRLSGLYSYQRYDLPKGVIGIVVDFKE